MIDMIFDLVDLEKNGESVASLHGVADGGKTPVVLQTITLDEDVNSVEINLTKPLTKGIIEIDVQPASGGCNMYVFNGVNGNYSTSNFMAEILNMMQTTLRVSRLFFDTEKQETNWTYSVPNRSSSAYLNSFSGLRKGMMPLEKLFLRSSNANINIPKGSIVTIYEFA